MVQLNLIPVTKFRTREFLDCVDIYGNEPIVVVKNDQPFLIGFPCELREEFAANTGWDAVENVTKTQIQRAEVFGKDAPDPGKAYVLADRGAGKYVFVRYVHFVTYPAVQKLFERGKLFEDYMWDYPKPFVPPAEAKRTMTARLLKYRKYRHVDAEYFHRNKAEVLETAGRLAEDQVAEIEKEFAI